MKKFIFTIVALLIAVLNINAAGAIDSDSNTKHGRIITTSGQELFIGCQMHLCAMVDNNKHPLGYALQLDLTDRMESAINGDCLTIHMADGNDIVLHNMYDTDAKVTEEETVQTYTQPVTRMRTYFNPYFGSIYSMPETYYYTQHIPTVTRTTFAQLYYQITPDQLSTIAAGKVKGITLCTCGKTLNKFARPLSSAVGQLYPTLLSYLDK